jgi:hypothetical protein
MASREPKTIPSDGGYKKPIGPNKANTFSKAEIQMAIELMAKAKDPFGKNTVRLLVNKLVKNQDITPDRAPVLAAVLFNLEDVIKRKDAASRVKQFVDPLEKIDERYPIAGERDPGTGEEVEAMKRIRGLRKNQKASQGIETSLPPRLYDAAIEALDSDAGRKLADRVIKREDKADRVPLPSGRRKGVTRAPVTELLQSGAINKIIDALPEEQRQALMLSIRHKQNIYDIAEQMNRTPPQVEQMLEDAKRKVAKELITVEKRMRGRLNKEKRKEMFESLMVQAKGAEEREERASTPDEPYKGPGATGGKVRMVGTPQPGDRVLTKPYDRKTDSGGKPLNWTFKDGKIRYYSNSLLEKMYNERSAFPEASRPPFEKSKLFRLNQMAKEGNAKAAILLQRTLNKMFGTKGTFEPSRTTNPVTGVESKKVKSVEEKQRGRAGREAKALGKTPTELAFAVQKARPKMRMSRKDIEDLKEGRLEQVPGGVVGRRKPKFTSKRVAELRRLVEKAKAEGVGSGDTLRQTVLNLMESERKEREAKGAASRKKPQPQISPEPRGAGPEITPAEVRALARKRRARTEFSPAEKMDRLRSILLSHGAVLNPREMGPHLPVDVTEYYGPSGRMRLVETRNAGASVPEIRSESAKPRSVGPASRKPIYKRPGKGPSVKETLFSRMARKRGGR